MWKQVLVIYPSCLEFFHVPSKVIPERNTHLLTHFYKCIIGRRVQYSLGTAKEQAVFFRCTVKERITRSAAK